MYICFNTNCNRWGECAHVKPRAYLAIWPISGTSTCDECGGIAIWHDNWVSDRRTHDDGTPVTPT